MMAYTEVPLHFKTEVLDDTKVTPHPDLKAFDMDDMEVTPPVDTQVIALTSMKLYVHADEWFPREPSDCYVLTEYFNHVVFILWQWEVCICYVEPDFLYY